MMRKFLFTTFAVITTLSLASCYRVPVPQGNYITPANAQEIKLGMPSSQVIAKLGNPVLTNTYLNNQLAYVYTFKKGFSRMQKRRLIIYFKQNRVVNVMYDDNSPNSAIPGSS